MSLPTSLDVGSSDTVMLPATGASTGQFMTTMDPFARSSRVPPPIYGTSAPNSHQQATLRTNGVGIVHSATAPSGLEREVHEQPNGQFQITENGALNLMKAESMDMLVVNNLAQDLSVGREQSIGMEKGEELPDTSLITEPLEDIYSSQQQQQLPAQQQVPIELSVSNCLSADSVSMAIAESLPGGFLSSFVQSNGNNLPYIDNLSSTIFTVPEVEVLTTNISSLGELPPSPEKLTMPNQPLQEQPTATCIMEMVKTEEEIISPNGNMRGLVNTLQSSSSSTETKQSETTAQVQCQWKGCSSKFNAAEELIDHVNITHVKCERDEEYKCHWQKCPRKGKGFNARYKMLIHVRTHTNEKPHVCSACGKSFSRLENLKIHARTHSGEKPYVCPVPNCNKAYANSSDRFKHVRTHQEDKPFACKMPGCGKRYTDPSSLRKHIKNHGHRVDGPVAPKTIKKTTVSGASNNASVASTIASPPCQAEDKSTEQFTSAQSTVVTLIPNSVLNPNSSTQVISINGSMLQISNLVSNPLLSSASVSVLQSKKPITQTGSSNSSSLVSPENKAIQQSDTLTKEDLDVGAKETLSMESEGQCLVLTTENGKSQDTPLDLSTCTALQSASAEENRNVNLQSIDVKLASIGCVLLADTK